MAKPILAAQVTLPGRQEEWEPVRSFEDFYEVSSLGRVRSLDRTITRRDGATKRFKGRILSSAKHNSGYRSVTLAKEGVNKSFLVHRLVAEAFLPRAPYHEEVNHKDGNKTNNAVENLEWCSRSENIQHSIKIGLFTKLVGSQKPASKLTERDVVEIRRHLESGMLVREVAARFGVSTAPISCIKHGKAWTHV